ncbi:hypothetical protein KBB96_19815 [Luteolibacter ambystomatis]|uniref:Alpha-2-macroglobulin n=1 Tax=Luteolibacter ambystomatis TaxID=2824561 RepID=A0A975J004_9BACT|nr:MG2 domain-containing protein [Luteolibacter ambystomatis]QUE51090.1 hypothetical protein KBB96_19815 [Luteolibacter ambystomatis]
MKTLRVAVLALASTMPGLWAAPRLFVSTPTLTPESGIELILDRAVVPDESVGKTAANDWLVVEPALAGKLEWRAPNVARFLPDQVPALGTTYKFSVRGGHKHIDQSPVPAGQIATVESTAFRIEATSALNRYQEGFTPRTASWLLRFNDDVDPAAAAPFFSFESKDGGRVAAKTVRATAGQAGATSLDTYSWSQRFARMKAKTPRDPSATRPANDPYVQGLIVTPVTPLPVGQDWKLSVLAGLPNVANNAKVKDNSSQQLGNIDPLRVTAMNAVTTADEPREIVIDFNLALPKEIPANILKSAIRLTPEPENLDATIQGSELHLKGDFGDDEWEVSITPPLASYDGRALAAGASKKLIFERLEPSLALPSTEEAQLAAGSRQYRIQTVNVQQVHVRARQISGDSLVRAFQGYRHYTGSGHDGADIKPTAPVPFELVPGKTVLEKDFELGKDIDTSGEVTLEWDKLISGAPKHGTFFVEATGTLTEGVVHEEGRPSAQAFVQLTDIGLAWKLTKGEALLYAFSCSTGEPLPGVKIDVYGEDAKALQHATTDADGVARVPRGGEARHLRASLGDDSYITAFDNSLATVSLWRFPIHYSYDEQPESRRRVLVFTDRSLYRPGETVRLKGIVRNQRGNAIEAADQAKPHLVITDPREKELINKEITLSPNGTFDIEYKTPDGEVGWYAVKLEYTDEVKKSEELPEDAYEEKERIAGNATFHFQFRVEEFRRNAFEVEQKIVEPAPGVEAVKIDLAANYYQGQPVAAGNAEHYTRIADVNLYPDRYQDFLFGNHHEEDWRYWYRYFNYRERDGDDDERSTAEEGKAQLDATGKATFGVNLPKGDFPTTREITVSTEVTDANKQTLTASSMVTVHPAAIYVGVSRTDRLVRVGDKVPLKLVAVTPDGKPYGKPVTIETVTTREVNEQSKTENDEGATVTRNDAHEEPVSTGSATIQPAGNEKDGTLYEFSATVPGRHFVTFKGRDAQGHAFATTTTYWVYGSNEYPWAYEEGMKIKLVAEKKSYRPGDVARVLVLSPIEGSALVTVERESVLRSFTVPLKADKPVIEIPLNEDDAPNAFVSVLVIKGSKDSARDFKEPQLRLGYCELTVEDVRNRLSVKVAAENSTETLPVSTGGSTTQIATYRPGDEVILAGTVTRADGSPAPGAEVTLYAEDEGTLAVMGYENPDPMAFFHDPRELGVNSGTSLDNFISENPDNQSFFNKGFFVGDGDDAGGDLSKLLRKNFDPCATWAPTLVTDAQGKFRHSFKVPDTLTRYRVLAVATEKASRFGTVKTDIVVNKPLMLEPKAPRFANEADLVTPQVLVQNASGHRGTWKITFTPNGDTGTKPVCRALAETTQTVTLDPNGSTTVPFPIAVENTGEAVLRFQAEPVSVEGVSLTPVLARKLGDAVETRFPVNYPMPLIRQMKLVKLAGPAAEVDIRSQLDPALLEGKGDLQMEFSRSLLMEAGASVDYLLSYPHGCVEQTTSSLMPWFAVKSLRSVVPSFEKVPDEKVKKAIQAGANRLLSMQLPSGGFTYWPGGRDRVDWASSYAGLGLVMADKEGAAVPEEAINNLCNDLTTSLRGITDIRSAWDMESATRALWVLSLAGKPQQAYHNLLRDRIESVPPRARRFLALAIAATNADNAKAEALAVLNSTKPFKARDDSWMPWNPDAAMDVLAWATIDPNSPETTRTLDRLFRDRNPYGEWRTTWMNGWSLLALSTYAKTEPKRDSRIAVTLTTAKGADPFTLSAETPVASRSFTTGGPFKATVKSDSPAFMRLKLAAKPKIQPQQPVASNGLEITRFYERLKSDGKSEPLDRPAVGDLVRVTLRVTLPKDDTRYLVVEDLLPSVFETVNSDFASQSAANGGRTSQNDWDMSHSELRGDRAVFYFDQIWRRGTYSVTYLARCTVPGEVTAPPAKVESMYDPEKFALSASQIIRTK